MTPHDGWALARLLSGLAVDGGPGSVSAEARPLFELLAGRKARDRRRALEIALCGPGVDRAAVLGAIEAADPADPAPSGGAEDDGPEAIRISTLAEVEPFPVEALTATVREVAEAVAESVQCPVDFPAFAALAAASVMIGQSAHLFIKQGWFESASLFGALIGRASCGKSPAINLMTRPLRDAEFEMERAWRDEHARWAERPEGKRGPEPPMPRLFTTDPTTEALTPLMAQNPRGLACIADEIAGWVRSLDQYKAGKGGDRTFYLSTWSGIPASVDRAKNAGRPVKVRHPFLTIVGGMTPGSVAALAEGGGDEDGFMARFLFCYPDHPPHRRYTEAGVDDQLQADWADLLARLRLREPRERDGDRPVPWVVRMTPGAARRWAQWCQAHMDEQEADDFPRHLEGSWGKLLTYAARLALVLHMLDLVADPTHDPAAAPPELPTDTLERALRLIRYFKSQARRVFGVIRGAAAPRSGAKPDHVRAVRGWIKNLGRLEFSHLDLTRGTKAFRNDPEALERTLDHLCRAGALELVAPPERDPGRPGRKPKPTYRVNPEFLTDPRFDRL